MPVPIGPVRRTHTYSYLREHSLIVKKLSVKGKTRRRPPTTGSNILIKTDFPYQTSEKGLQNWHPLVVLDPFHSIPRYHGSRNYLGLN